jgi:hypothetical protein
MNLIRDIPINLKQSRPKIKHNKSYIAKKKNNNNKKEKMILGFLSG